MISKTVVSPQPDADEQKDLDGESPFATMTVYETTGQFNQRCRPSLARGVGLVSFDPLLPGNANEGLSEVLDFDPRSDQRQDHRLAGRVSHAQRQNDDWLLTVNLSTYFDPSESRLYALEVICSRRATTRVRTRSTRSSTPGGSDNEYERLRPRRRRMVVGAPAGHRRPRSATRRKMFFFDRIKVLVLLAVFLGLTHLASEDRHPVDELGRGISRPDCTPSGGC